MTSPKRFMKVFFLFPVFSSWPLLRFLRRYLSISASALAKTIRAMFWVMSKIIFSGISKVKLFTGILTLTSRKVIVIISISMVVTYLIFIKGYYVSILGKSTPFLCYGASLLVPH